MLNILPTENEKESSLSRHQINAKKGVERREKRIADAKSFVSEEVVSRAVTLARRDVLASSGMPYIIISSQENPEKRDWSLEE